MDIAKLRHEAETAQVLLANLKDVIADDEQTAHDMIEGETSLIEVIAEAVSRVIDLEAFDAALAERASALSQRRSRLQAQAERIRTAIVVAMADVDLKKIELAEATITRKPVPAKVIVTSEADLPSKYLVEKVSVSPDKKALLEALKAGEQIAGTCLSNTSETLAIRKG